MALSDGRLDGMRGVTKRAAISAGFAARRGATILRQYPIASLGLATFSAFFVWMSGNALFAQQGAHPAPLITTRGAPEPSLDLATGSVSDPTLKSLQAALAQTGYYAHQVDGRFGPATQAAIEKFQNENGLAVNGRVSPALIKEVRQLATLTTPSPSPRPADWTDAEEVELSETADGRGGRVLQTGSTDGGSAITGLESVGGLSEVELVRRIQTGLTAVSVADLQADGIAGNRTKAAIATFEALEGMDVTGEPDPRVLERLIQIGAL